MTSPAFGPHARPHVCAVLFADSASRFARQSSGDCSGELGPPPTAHGAQAALPEAATAKGRSIVLAVPLQDLEGLAPCLNHRQTRDRSVLASPGFPPLLELDFEEKRHRPPRSRSRDARLDTKDGRRQPALGSAQDSWRAAEAGHRDLRAHGFPIDAQEPEASLPDVEGFLEQSCPGSGLGGFLHGSDGYLSRPVCLGRAGSSPPACGSLQRDGASDGCLDRTTDD